MDGWGVPRRALAVAALAALLWGSAVAWHAAEPWARAGVLFTDGVLRLPVRPLTWVTSDPTHAELAWGEPGAPSAARGVLTLPAGPGPHPAVVLALGAEAAGPDDLRVVRLTDALARLGVGALYPLSSQLDAGVVEPAEIERLVGAWSALAADPRVRPERVGFVGLSVGGSLSLMAAADAGVAEEVWFVLAIGPYAHAGLLAAETASGVFASDDGRHEWEPRAITRRVLLRSLTEALGDEERAAALLAPARYDEAAGRLAEANAGLAAWIAALSPIAYLDGLRAPLYLLHDDDDRFVPWSHSEQLAAVRSPEVYHRTDLFEHVDPQPGSLEPVLTDGWRLWRLFARIFDEAR
jgi:acetyl esterase/lipase